MANVVEGSKELESVKDNNNDVQMDDNEEEDTNVNVNVTTTLETPADDT